MCVFQGESLQKRFGLFILTFHRLLSMTVRKKYKYFSLNFNSMIKYVPVVKQAIYLYIAYHCTIFKDVILVTDVSITMRYNFIFVL